MSPNGHGRRATFPWVRTSTWLVLALLSGCGQGTTPPPPPSGAVLFMGRFDTSDPARPRFSFSGSRVVTRFDGSELRVRLAEAGPNRYGVRVDGAEQPVLASQAGTHTYTLVSGLPAGEHDLVLARRTESFFGVTQLLGFEGARLLAAPPPPARFIEFVGDSITCGYGVLGDGPECKFSADSESEPDAFGTLTAEALGAGHAAIACSGKGVLHNYGNDPSNLMPAVYLRTSCDNPGADWGFAGYRPDVVVVNLGTNDYWQGEPGQPFSDAFDAFLQVIRARNPGAWIVLALSPMLSDAFPAGALARSSARTRLTALVAAAHARGDTRVDFVELDEQQEADGLGCNYHPGKLTQMKMAATLVTRIRALTGW